MMANKNNDFAAKSVPIAIGIRGVQWCFKGTLPGAEISVPDKHTKFITLKNVKLKLILFTLLFFFSCTNKSEKIFFEKYYDSGVNGNLITEKTIRTFIYDNYMFVGNDNFWLFFIDCKRHLSFNLEFDPSVKSLNTSISMKIIKSYEDCINAHKESSIFGFEVTKNNVCIDFFVNDGRDEQHNRIVTCISR